MERALEPDASCSKNNPLLPPTSVQSNPLLPDLVKPHHDRKAIVLPPQFPDSNIAAFRTIMRVEFAEPHPKLTTRIFVHGVRMV